MTLDLDTLKQVAHRGVPLLERAGLALSHKQCLDLVARMHGFANYEAAKASLGAVGKGGPRREPPATKDAAGGSSTASTDGGSGWLQFPSEGSADDLERRRRLSVLTRRLDADLYGKGNGAELVMDLASVAIATLAKEFPPALSSDDRRKIMANYPSATPDLIEERSMSVKGLGFALATAEMLCRIAVDYCPSSDYMSDVSGDDKVAQKVGKPLSAEIAKLFEWSTSNGMSTFGVTCTFVLSGLFLGAQAGLPFAKLARPAIDGLGLVLKNAPGGLDLRSEEEIAAAEKEADERAMAAVMQLMGIGKAEARRYLAQAKRMRAEEGPTRG